MYTLLVCADLYSEKINLELTFPTMPTIGELQRKIIEVFNAEANAKRPPGFPAIDFTIARLQIYDDVLLKWADLVACTQLHEYDQLYAFQPQSPWHIDVQKDLPPPRPPQQPGSGAAPAAAPLAYNNNATPVGVPRGGNASGVYGASPAPAYAGAEVAAYGSGGGASALRVGSSPQTVSRLEEQRRKEQALQAELARMREETLRLEQQAAAELEEERRRAAEDAQRLLRQKEEDMRAQREALLRAEEEYRRLQEEANFRHQASTRFRN